MSSQASGGEYPKHRPGTRLNTTIDNCPPIHGYEPRLMNIIDTDMGQDYNAPYIIVHIECIDMGSIELQHVIVFSA